MTTKILVVEDEALVGMDLVMLLEDWRYTADGPHASVEDAIRAVDAFDPEIAILDMHLRDGETSLPIAEALVARGTPFLFITGDAQADAGVSQVAQSAPKLKKPVSESELRSVLDRLTGQVGAEG